MTAVDPTCPVQTDDVVILDMTGIRRVIPSVSGRSIRSQVAAINDRAVAFRLAKVQILTRGTLLEVSLLTFDCFNLDWFCEIRL
ncbi:hypothetical protein L596_021307 [Steinernema carpocapsae]|uniref:Uncharacterized protein n=1 Tax=Steinernema carpocapsae TaxID=34508 RepID=A0A4U5MI96_STECR|nr:hypothetical protein L596_021307 [Steinernema carpocapsae]